MKVVERAGVRRVVLIRVGGGVALEEDGVTVVRACSRTDRSHCPWPCATTGDLTYEVVGFSGAGRLLAPV